MKFRKYFRNHVRFCHRIQCTGTSDHKGVPGSDNTAHTTYDDNFRHYRGSKSLCHRICCYQSCCALWKCNLFRIQDITNCKDYKRIKYNCKYYRKDHHFTNLFEWHIDFFCCLWNNVKTNKEKRSDNCNFQDIFCHAASCLTHKHLSLQIIHIAIDHRCHDQKDAGSANDTGQNGLEYSCCFCSHNVDHHDEEGNNNCNDQPGSIDIKSGNRIKIAFQKSRPQIGDDRRKRTCLKTGNTYISKNNRPGTDKGSCRPHCLIAEYMLTTTLRHSRCQLSICKTDEEDHDTTDCEGKCCTDNTTGIDPCSGRYDPAPADHSAKSDHKNVPCTEYFIKFWFFLSHSLIPPRFQIFFWSVLPGILQFLLFQDTSCS